MPGLYEGEKRAARILLIDHSNNGIEYTNPNDFYLKPELAEESSGSVRANRRLLVLIVYVLGFWDYSKK